MMDGNIPDEFADTQIMAATGWNWFVLKDTPAPEVELMVIWLAVKNTRDGGGRLNFGQKTKDVDDGTAQRDRRTSVAS